MFDHLPAPPGEQELFHGFTLPTTTPIPDQLIDDWLPQLSGAEVKVVLYICRRTLGFQKISDNISLQQLLSGLVKKNGERLDYGTGLSKPTLLKTLRDLQDKGIIATVHRSSTERGDEATNYRLCFAEGVHPLVCQRRLPEVTPVGWRRPAAPPGQKSLPGGRTKMFTTGVVKKSRPQETEEHKTDQQETDVRAISSVLTTTSSAPSIFGGGVISDEAFWSMANQPAEELLLEKNSDTDSSLLPASPPPNSGEPPSPAVDRRQTGARALIALGMTAKVAYRLAEHYSLERIEEKLGYLDFLQQHQPHTVKNPCGWLRTAIEDDFAAPDGYCSSADQEQQLAATLALADALLTPPEPQATPPQESRLLQWQAQYEITEEDRTFWQQTLSDLDTMGRSYLYDLVVDACLLRVTEDTALIGVPDSFQHQCLQHPHTRLALSRTLTQLAGRALVPKFVLLQE